MSVYFARVGEYVKIGYSRNPVTRVQRLRSDDTARPDDLDKTAPVELLAVVPGGRDLERALQEVLVGLRECGEWFRIPEPSDECPPPHPDDHLLAEAMSRIFARMPSLQGTDP